MKKLYWVLLATASAGAAALRFWQMRSGFDALGLPVSRHPAALSLLVLLLAASAAFIGFSVSLRRSRIDEDREITAYFPGGNTCSAALGIGGAFLLAASAAFSLLGYRASLMETLLPIFLLASAAAALRAVFLLFRAEKPDGTLMLFSVSYLALHLIFLYRKGASDPVLGHYVIALLAVAALAAALLEAAAFAFRNGSPCLFLLAGSLAAVLSFAAAAELRSLAQTLFFAGFALVDLSFLSGASLPAVQAK